MTVKTKRIASLEPGKTYVLRANFRTREDHERFKQQLETGVPGIKFVILPRGVELLTSVPEDLITAEELTGELESAKQ
jgi:hypothetical protein